MTTKEYLEQYKNWHYTKLNLLDERKLIVIEEALPAGIDYSADRVQTSPDDGMVKKIERIQRRAEKIDKRIVRLTERMEALKDKVNTVPAPSNRILYLRYIEFKDWPDVAMDMTYSEAHIKGPMHMQALSEFSKIIRNNTD